MRKNLLGLVFMLLLTEALVSACEIHMVKGGSSTIVIPDDFPSIQEGINNAVNGDTIFVKTGTYYEHVTINKTVSIVGEDVETSIIDGNNTGHVVHVISDNVSVSGFTLQNSGSIQWPYLEAGVCLNGTTDCDISENLMVGNGFIGISLLNSQRTTITGNNVTRIGWAGIHLMNSSNNTVSGNILDSNTYVGINGHVLSNHNNIKENVITNSTYGMFFHNVNHNNIRGNNISDITVEGIWLQDLVSYNTLAENKLTNCSVGIKLLGPNYNNIISGNILTDGQSGIWIETARYTEISNNTIAHNYGGDWDAGIRLDSAGYSQIHSNLVTDNWRGILLYTSSPRVSIYNNIITSNEYAVRVASGGSNYLNISDNIVKDNRGYGIGLTGFGGMSNYATISRNLIVNNSDGIALGRYSNYNSILRNNISQNGYGFYVEYSSENTIWQNNIVDNDQQAQVSLGSVNNWDRGYLMGGNYWSDHICTGNPSNGSQPYTVDVDEIDNHPFQHPNGWLLHQLTVTSAPIIGITFTINETTQTTAYTEWMLENYYTVQMPKNHNAYVWSHWLEDNDTNRVKIVIMNTNIMLTGVYYYFCDLDKSGKVDMRDIAVIGLAFGSDPDHPRWDPNVDINKDDRIDMKDLAITASNFGKA